MYDRIHKLLQELNTHNIYSDLKMPNEDEQERLAKEQAEAAEKAKAEAERQQREDAAAVTRGLSDETNIKQLSSTGDAAKKKRGK
jgi:hypothetical protein